VTARVRFSFPESRWVLNQQVGRPVDAELDDGGAILEFDVRNADPFLRWLLTFGAQVEVLEPESIRVHLRDLRLRVAALYA
jgi:predicted DNA-binding transcriptional regulator YafY